jgi:hypothetical protein
LALGGDVARYATVLALVIAASCGGRVPAAIEPNGAPSSAPAAVSPTTSIKPATPSTPSLSTPFPIPAFAQRTPGPTITPASCRVAGPQIRGPDQAFDAGVCAEAIPLFISGQTLFVVTAVRGGDGQPGYGFTDETVSVRATRTGSPLWQTVLHHESLGPGTYFAGITTYVPGPAGVVHVVYFTHLQGASCCAFGGGVIAAAPDGSVREVLNIPNGDIYVTPCKTLYVRGPTGGSNAVENSTHFDREYKWDGMKYGIVGEQLLPPPTMGGAYLPLSCGP